MIASVSYYNFKCMQLYKYTSLSLLVVRDSPQQSHEDPKQHCNASQLLTQPIAFTAKPWLSTFDAIV